MTYDRHRKTLYLELQDVMAEQEGVLGCEEAPDLFFPEDFTDKRIREENILLAKQLCKQCPIRLQCLSYAIQANESWGIWGGTTPKER